MKWPDPAQGPASLANRMLADQAWAREKLSSVAGRVFSLTVGPLSATWSITDDGRLASAPAGAASDLRLTLSPLSVPSFLADPSRWNELVREEGDAALGGVLKELARTMPWFVEETFAKAFGPVAGQRVADAGRRLLAFPEYAAQRLAESAGSYARDEAGLLASGREFRILREGIEEVTARVDALAERIDALVPRVRPIRPG
jgi:ubiquinone biosynthesis accessory factor UbiJ